MSAPVRPGSGARRPRGQVRRAARAVPGRLTGARPLPVAAPMQDQSRSGLERWSLPRLATAAVAVCAVVGWAGKLEQVAVLVVGAVVFALLLDVPVRVLANATRGRLSRGAATALVLVVTLGLGGVALAAAVPSLAQEARDLSAGRGDIVHALVEAVNVQLGRLPVHLPAVPARYASAGSLLAHVHALSWVRSGGQSALAVFVALFTGAWACAQPEQVAHRLLLFVPPARRGRAVAVSGAVLDRLRRWLAGQLLLGAGMGTGLYVVFRVLHVPFAGLFAVVAGFCELVPSVGVILSFLGPAVMLTLAAPARLAWLALGFVIVHQVEDRFLAPSVMRRAVDLPQALLLLSMSAFGVLFGPVGLVLAVPLTAAAVTLHDELVAHPRPQVGELVQEHWPRPHRTRRTTRRGRR